jgi:hypothetical protein
VIGGRDRSNGAGNNGRCHPITAMSQQAKAPSGVRRLEREISMLNMSRRDVVVSAGLAAALGLNSRLSIVGSALAQPAPEAGKGFYKYKVGSVEVTALYDGLWKKRPGLHQERQHRRYQG